MKRFARFLIRLYPAHWRERYGEEFEALLEDSSPGWPAIFDLLKGATKMQLAVPSFPKLALMLSLSGLLTGLLVSVLVTPRYVSTASMTVDVNPAVSATAPNVRPNPVEYFMQMKNEILSRTSLSATMQDPRLDLYQEDRTKYPLEDVIEKMRQDTQITVEGSGGAYVLIHIAFACSDGVKARDTVQALITKFFDSNRYYWQATAHAKRERSTDQIDRLEARIALLEKRLGIPPTSPEPRALLEQLGPSEAGINLSVLDPPSYPAQPLYPDRVRFMATGFGAGLAAALLIAIFRRRPPPIPFPAQTA